MTRTAVASGRSARTTTPPSSPCAPRAPCGVVGSVTIPAGVQSPPRVPRSVGAGVAARSGARGPASRALPPPAPAPALAGRRHDARVDVLEVAGEELLARPVLPAGRRLVDRRDGVGEGAEHAGDVPQR